MERFWHYRYETEHRDLRRVMGIGIAITRGAAAALSFCMGLILLTVCRNVLTLIRETPIGEFLPLDAAITFHKIVGITAGVFSAIHTVGHCINFYHAVFGSNFIPSISYWFFGTITGITGILLVAIMSIIYVFSMPAVLKRAYHAFRVTHMLNVMLYALTILHGLPKLLRLAQILQYKELQIVEADTYPSDIIYIQFKRPHSFKFRSGQWVRVSCPSFSSSFNKHHAFSIASCPQSPYIELYIKAVGPWTWQLRHEITDARTNGLLFPTINLSGPFGDGNQEWHNYDVVVMVGGGIGVTPYASTLMDLVTEKASGNHSNIRCKKVYFLWICPTHKNFECCGPSAVNKQIRKACTDANRVRNAPSFVHRFETF
ncbi:NAD(P)H oxidase (H(2)O(2)-forming) [Aphelenchoides fujianensis]|nr:NAD(P)H oxidase (H(2)O(2)-forming) [Aphelenchoides fujianensis]